MLAMICRIESTRSPEAINIPSSRRSLWASLLYVLAGQYERAGVLGELVMQASDVKNVIDGWAYDMHQSYLQLKNK